MSALEWIGVGLLGGAGALARVLVAGSAARRLGARAPLGILVVNVSGAFALGLLAGASRSGPLLTLAGAGFLGAYTTFSTWMLETRDLAAARERTLAAANLLVPLAAGLGAVALGRALG